jgi:hypothetical protein
MKMRNWLITLLAMLLAFTACQPEPIVPDIEDSFDPAKLHFNLAIQHPEGTTKGVKSNWENGDKVFIFIPSITTGYLTATFNGTIWTASYEGTGTSLSALGDSGLLHAVYLPYVNDATPVFSNNTWTFNTGTDSYFFYASKQNYKVETVGEDHILLATIQMQYPGDYVQFFIPYDNPTGTIQLACNALRPAGFASITADNGEVTEITGGNAGAPIYGYADTLAGGVGYYVSGKSVASSSSTASTADYYFAVKKDDIYSHYYKNRGVITANKAYQLPAYSAWPVVGSSRYVQIANSRWKTVNEEASDPWAMGTLFSSSVLSTKVGIPTNSDWSNLKDSQMTTWIPMSIWGSQGYLVASKSTPQKYIFIPWSGEASYYWMAGFTNSFKIADSTYTIPEPAVVPETAYVRTLNKLTCFRIKAKEDGTKVYFQYTDGSVLYSKDYGDTWLTPPTKTNGGIGLDANEEVYFKGTRTDCNLQGDKQLFTTNGKVCYIAGEITSLLADPTTLPANAFRSAFSYGDVTDTNAENLEKNIPAASGTVNWVDIDPNDPLILPASTAAFCYTEMFMGCTSLHSAPDLPATVLADKCYFRMFYNCTGLSSIPSFASEVTMSGTSNRRRYCFQMFQNCTGIKALTGSLFGGTTTLAPNCFEDMFANCTNLKSVDENFLPATTLAASCYRGMFQNTRFERAPKLLATTLVTYCYRYMFYNCSELNYIKCLATNPPSNNDSYTRDWVGGSVPNSNTCTFIRNNNEEMTNSWTTGAVYGIPSNWTVKQVKDEE